MAPKRAASGGSSRRLEQRQRFSGRTTTKMTKTMATAVEARTFAYIAQQQQQQDMKAMGHAGSCCHPPPPTARLAPQRRTHNQRLGRPARTKWRWKVVRRGGRSDEI